MNSGYIKEDLNRYFVLMSGQTLLSQIMFFVFCEGAWILVSYRMGQWVNQRVNIPLIRFPLKLSIFLLHTILKIITKIEIPFEADIGKGLYIGHGGYIVINQKVRLGSFCNLSPGIIIGEGGRNGCRGVPTIGNRVYIGPGAKIFGPISIGDNVVIGANAVVFRDIPDNAVVGGIPAEILNFNGSKDFVVTSEDDFPNTEQRIK